MRVYVQPVSSGRAIPVSTDSTSVQTHPRWSPDGGSLLFITAGSVVVTPALGGAPRQVIPAGGRPVRSVAWSPDGKALAFVRADSLFIRDVAGGATRFLAEGPTLNSCDWGPDGWFACVSGNPDFAEPVVNIGNIAPSTILVFSSNGTLTTTIGRPGSANLSPVWAHSMRRLYYVSNALGPRDIYYVDVERSGRARGEPQRLSTGLNAQAVSLSSDDRRLAYSVYTETANIWSVPLPGTLGASMSDARALTTGRQVIETMEASGDGRWMYYSSNIRGSSNIYRIPLSGGEPERLTSDPADDFAPEVSPDGREVAFHSFRSGSREIFVLPLDGGAVQQVTSSPGQERSPHWSPDGRALAYFDAAVNTTFVVRRDARNEWGKPQLVAHDLTEPSWSPDGGSLVGAGTRGELIRVAFPTLQATVLYGPQATGEPAVEKPKYSADGTRIRFKAHDAIGRASFWEIRPGERTPRLLVSLGAAYPSTHTGWSTDGKRLYFALFDHRSDIWVAELQKR